MSLEVVVRTSLLERGQRMAKTPPRNVKVTYQLQYRKCGKPTCKCKEGLGHGPYWYAFWRDPDTHRLMSAYIGKRKPADAANTRHRVPQPTA